MTSTDGRKSLVIYLVCEPETPELARAAPRDNTASLRVLEKLGMRRVGFAGATPRFEL